jgi:hypothetical protein
MMICTGNVNLWFDSQGKICPKCCTAEKITMKPNRLLLPAAWMALVTFHVRAATLYVDLNCTNPVPPYTDWSTAATNIQDAIDASTNGDLVLVTNGIYLNSGRTAPDGALTSVVVTNMVTMQSVNGPAVTLINGNQAMRCVYLANDSVLTGVTVTNGAAGYGGGVWSASTSGIITNCVIAGSSAFYGGGIYSGTLYNCTLDGNSADGSNSRGGGACNSTLNHCTLTNNSAEYGAGAFIDYNVQCSLNNCILINNSATWSGGGIYGGNLNNCLFFGNATTEGDGGGAAFATLNNCLIISNATFESGGGTYVSTVNNCTLVNNSSSEVGGGDADSTVHNSVLFYNTAPDGSNYIGDGEVPENLYNCCTTPLPDNGSGNITNEPVFVGLANDDFHLQSNSPCINSGNNIYVSSGTDSDGHPRIVGGTVDVGCYEYQSPKSVISYAWLQQYGLPADGSVDYLDLDGTGMNNRQKWIAGLNPTNSTSVLAMLPLVATNNPAGVTVRWQSVNDRTYYLQRATDLTAQPPFTTLQSNIIGQAGTTSYTDVSATNGGAYLYRVGVQ